jgi:tetratricopeptide (TPR) repeat protein
MPKSNSIHHSSAGSNSNSILALVQHGEYEAGCVAYAQLENPSGEDTCWAGMCFMRLGKFVEATGLLATARAQGFEAATVILVIAYRRLSEHKRSQELLQGIQVDRLDVVGMTLLEQERGAAFYGQGRYRDAVCCLERALDLSASPGAAFVRPGLISMLSFVLADIGHIRRALDYVDLALEKTVPSQRPVLLTQRAFCKMNLGDLEAAALDLQAARSSDSWQPSFEVYLQGREGQLAFFQGAHERAMDHFATSARLARQNREPENELSAELFAAQVATVTCDQTAARVHLNRARGLLNPDSERYVAHLECGQGALLTQSDDPQAIVAFERAAEIFSRFGLERELGLVLLRLAEVLYRLERRAEGDAALRRATDARHSCDALGAFAFEIRDLPFVLETLCALEPGAYSQVLLEDWRTLEQRSSGTLFVKTLGEPGLTWNGQKITVTSGLARTIEVIAYLLEHQTCSLEDLQSNVFADKNPHDARGYVHVIRSFVRTNLHGLSMPFDSASRTYSLELNGLHLQWDAFEISRAIKLGSEAGFRRALGLYAGRFLIKSESDWVVHFRNDLETGFLRAGWRTLEALHNQASFEHCRDLARSLLEIHPTDVEVGLMLLKATKKLEGSQAAGRELAALRKRFEHELGECPEAIEELARGWTDSK